MKTLNGRKVSELRIHQTTMAQGYGNFKNTIGTSNKTANDTEMTLVEGGILVKSKDSRSKQFIEMFIPNGNIVSAQLLSDVEGQFDIKDNKGSKVVTASIK
jgi:hypothetical protein